MYGNPSSYLKYSLNKNASPYHFVFLNSYKIKDIDRNELELTAKIQICLEEKNCQFETVLFDRQRLPKPDCGWNLNFTLPGLL